MFTFIFFRYGHAPYYLCQKVSPCELPEKGRRGRRNGLKCHPKPKISPPIGNKQRLKIIFFWLWKVSCFLLWCSGRSPV